MNYAVRITHSYKDAKVVVDKWAEKADKLLVYEHVGSVTEKVHIHLIIVGSKVAKKQLRNIGTDTGVDLKGNAMCSFKEYDGDDKAIVYMTKGKHDPSYNKGYTIEYLEEMKNRWKDKKKESSDELLYEFVFGDDEHNENHYADWCTRNEGTKFKWVKNTAWNAAFLHNGMIANQAMVNKYKMLVYTYCARNSLKIDENDKTFKALW